MTAGGWNKGLTKETDERVAANAIAISVANKGQIPWTKGLTKETDLRVAKMSVAVSVANTGNPRLIAALIKKYQNLKEREKSSVVGIEVQNRSDVIIAKSIAFTIPDRSHIGKNNNYPLSFFDVEAMSVFERDNNQCQFTGCNKTKEDGQIDRHHKDFDKNNSDPNNLICLCIKHHKYIHKHNIILE